MLRYRTYYLIKLKKAGFASEFVFKFLIRHKLAIAVQQVLYKKNVVVKPFTDEYGLPVNEDFFVIEYDHILSSIVVIQGFQFIEKLLNVLIK